MHSLIKRVVDMWKHKANSSMTLAHILSTEASREELLGMKTPKMPEPTEILDDANKVVSYSHSADYRVFAKETWSHVLAHLDAIQDPRASADEVNFHRGALKEALDLLRVSYRARIVKEQLENEVSVSSAR